MDRPARCLRSGSLLNGSGSTMWLGTMAFVLSNQKLASWGSTTPVPGEGVVPTPIANVWFDKTNAIVPNHIVDPEPFSSDPERKHLAGRSIIVHRAEALPVEAIVRGYLTGSGRKDYEKTGRVCGIELPAGLVEASRLPEPLFTPSTKAAIGGHDENISFDRTVERD